MFMRLIRDYSRDNKAAIALMTVAFMPLFLVLIYTAHDIGRYFMVQRTVASASQQTYDWIVARGASASEDANALAKTALTTRLGKNIVDDGSGANGIKNITVTVSRNSKNDIARIDIKGQYNLMLGNLLNLPTFPIAATVGKVIDPPIFITIVFNSGEMRSEGTRIYGNLQTVNNAVLLPGPNRGVSWSNLYYTDFLGQTVPTRDMPTTNYFMVTALVKQLVKKYAGRTIYMNIIPVSATINLNPGPISGALPGSNEGKLPPWTLNSSDSETLDSFFLFNLNPQTPRCISNRSFPGSSVTGSIMRDYYEVQASEIRHTDRSITNTKVPPVFFNKNGVGNSFTSLNKNFFSHENLLKDNKLRYSTDEGVGTSSNGSLFNLTRGYPSFILAAGSSCPAINTTPALGSFQQVTTQDYPMPGGTTENDIFWDYMRNHIDPDKVSNYAIWGSPNMNFGLQIAYENIGHVQNTGTINNNGKKLDPKSEFLVFMVSDQIGAVKNVAGVSTAIIGDSFGNVTKNKRAATKSLYTQCVSVGSGPGNSEPGLAAGCVVPDINANILNPTPVLFGNKPKFEFSHFGYDDFYNLAGPFCFDGPTYQEYTCDSMYSATTVSVIQNFYNIINYSLDIKYNNDLAKKLIKPRVFFIDTGSGKPTNQCEMVNGFTSSFFDKTGSEFDPRIGNKFCTAYTDLVGYKKDPLPRKFVACAPKTNCPFSNLPSGGVSQGGIFSVTSDPPMLFAPNPSNPLKRGNLWAGDKTESITGLTGVFTYQINEFTDTNVDSITNTGVFVPVQFYPIAKKLMVNSNPLSLIDENGTTSRQTNVNNAAEIASFVANNMDSFPAITSPY